ncbi:MAG: acyltransferase family protein [Candidatus Sulfotelmatobacter sp.]
MSSSTVTTINPAATVAPAPVGTGESGSEASSSKRIPALDGLRGIAILLVLTAHSFTDVHFNHFPVLNWLVRMTRLSWSGVDLFFVLSGFLIGGILLDAQDSPNYFKTFYIRRAYRILPLYFLVLILGWLAFHAGQLGWIPGQWAELFNGKIPWWPFFTFTQNISMGIAGRTVGRGVLSPTWSLAVEEQFYLTLPFLVRYASRRRLVQIVLGFIVGAAFLRFLVILYLPGHMFITYAFMPCRADALGLGVLVALVARNPKAWSCLQEHRAWLYGAASIPFLILLLIDLSSFEPLSATLYGAEYSVLAAFYASLLLIAVTGKDWFVTKVFCNRLLTKLGLIAYGTYLFHRFTLRASPLVLSSIGGFPPAEFAMASMLLGLGSAILTAQLSWTWFEKPLLRRGHRYSY